MNKQYLDLILVPSGLVLLVAYHVWLNYVVLKHPTKTDMGINAINRCIWVQTMMENPEKTGVLAVQSLRNNIMASTFLATLSVMLGSLIAVTMTNTGAPRTLQDVGLVYGVDTQLGLSVKFFAILVCFLLTFLFDVQSIRYYSDASILINVPVVGNKNPITVDYVTRTLNGGAYCWSLGLRAFYLSFPLFFWIFGPVPMFLCCVVMVRMLYFIDFSNVIEISGKQQEDGSMVQVSAC